MAKFTPIYSYNLDFIESTNNSDYWYITGLLAADGYITDEKIELCLATKDKNIIKKIRDIVCPDKKLRVKKNKGSGSIVLKLDNREMATHFKKKFSMKSNLKHKEMVFPKIPKKYLKDFVRGYFDGDGTVDTTKGYQTVQGKKKIYIGPRIRILGNEGFLTTMLEEIRKQVPNKTFAVNKKGKENVYVITYNFSVASAILDWMYDTESELFLERKYDKYQQVCNKLEDIV